MIFHSYVSSLKNSRSKVLDPAESTTTSPCCRSSSLLPQWIAFARGRTDPVLAIRNRCASESMWWITIWCSRHIYIHMYTVYIYMCVISLIAYNCINLYTVYIYICNIPQWFMGHQPLTIPLWDVSGDSTPKKGPSKWSIV